MVARRDRDAGLRLHLLDDLRQPQAGAGDEHRIELARPAQARASPAATEAGEMRAASRSSCLRKVANAATSSTIALEIRAHVRVHLGRIGRQHADPPRAKRREGGEGGGRPAWCRQRQVVPRRISARLPPPPSVHARRGAAERDHVELQAGQDQRRRRRDQLAHRPQARGRDIGIVVEPRVIDGHAVQPDRRRNSCSIV